MHRSTLAASLALFSSTSLAQAADIRFSLDWSVQGIHSWFYLAEAKGYFEEEGLNVVIDQGEGSAATVTRIMSGVYDAGFGDINAVIQNAVQNPDSAPVMVYQLYNQPPFAVLTKADGPIGELADLEGASVGAPAGSASTRLFPAMAQAAGFDADAVNIVNVAPNLQEQMLIQDQIDASLVFNVTSYMNLVGQGQDPEADFRWFPYGEAGLDVYSNGVMVSQRLIENDPDAVAGLVRAINRAVMDVIADPAEGLEALRAVEPLLDIELEGRRLQFALDNVILSQESEELGIGAIDPERLERSIGVIASQYELASEPDPALVYSADFLPALDERRPD